MGISLVQRDISLLSNSYKLPNGTIKADYYHLKRPDYILVIAYKDNKLLVERQYRRGVDDFVYELPAGWINEGETPEQAALRELSEETGYSGNAKLLGKIYPQPGFCSMLAFVVSVELDDISGIEKPDEDESITSELVSLRVLKRIRTV